MLPRRYRFGEVHSELSEIFDKFLDFPFSSNYSFRGRLVNEDDYDIIPKKSLIERQIKEKEQRLQELKDRRKNDERWYEEQEKKLSLELDQLKQKALP